MNVAYKHLNAKLRIGDLTTGQWASALFGVVLMLGWGFYLSPLPPYPTIITAVYIGGVPIGLAMLASFAELNIWRFARRGLVWMRSRGTYSAGPGDDIRGYRLTPDPRVLKDATGARGSTIDLAGLWA